MRMERHAAGPLARALLAAGLAAMTAACAARGAPADTTEDLVDRRLEEAGERVTADLARLTGSTQNLDAAEPVGAMARPMSLDYDGPITQALEKVCARAGFTLSVVGTPRPVPVVVHVHARERPLLHILRGIGLQTGPHERLRVVEQARLVELVWLDAAPASPAAGKAAKPGKSRRRP